MARACRISTFSVCTFINAWVRVSGTWATKTYYDFEGTTNGKAPEGYENILTKEQWIGVLDFVKALDAKLLTSMSNCEGLHKANEPWNPSEAEKLFSLSKEYGVPIDAVEFVNEPNMMDLSGLPKGYTAKDFARDQDIFHKWVRDNYQETIIVGPCSTGVGSDLDDIHPGSGGIGDLMPNSVTTDELMAGTTEKLVFTTTKNTPISPRDTTVVMKYIFKRIALKEPQFKPLSPHTLRHTFATRCIERGMNPKTLQIILGHSTIQITMNLYCHVTDDMLISEMSKFEAGTNNENQPIGVKVV